jgi:hypothetical protein
MKMRAVVALGLSIALCNSGNAAAPHPARSRHLKIRDGRDRGPVPAPTFSVPNRTGKVLWPPVLEDQTPSYDDPSKFGGE